MINRDGVRGTEVSLDGEQTLILLDVDVEHLGDALKHAVEALVRHRGLSDEHLDSLGAITSQHLELGPSEHLNSVAIVHDQIVELSESYRVLLRFRSAIDTHDDVRPTWFMWVLLSDEPTPPPQGPAGGLAPPHPVEFAHLIEDEGFRELAIAAETPEALEQAYFDALSHDVHPSEAQVPPELQRTGRLFGGVLKDIQRRLPHYASDFTDGFNSKTFASVFFLFFACLAPAVAFGGLLSVLTDGSIGAIEMIVATAVCGVTYALASGQPLTILGSTGPVIIFMGILYSLCSNLGIPYMPTLACVGLWTSAFLIVLAATDASSLIRYFTRFTDDTFAALISVIFIVEALKDMVGVFTDGEVSYATALLSTILALGTFQIAMALSRARRSVYLLRPMREFLADFGPTIAIGLMTAVAFVLHEVELETLAVPTEFRPTSDRSWLVNPLDAPMWVWFASAVPAALVSILLYLDQNITVRLVRRSSSGASRSSRRARVAPSARWSACAARCPSPARRWSSVAASRTARPPPAARASPPRRPTTS